jgi:hypothetical protein
MSRKISLKIITHVDNLPTEKAVTKTDMFAYLAASVKDETNSLAMMATLSKQKEMPKEKHHQKWSNIADYFCNGFKERATVTTAQIGGSHIEFYQEYLKQQLQNIWLKQLKSMIIKGVFDHYNPAFQPLAFVSIQLRFPDDVWPKIDAIVALDHLLKYGLIPPNIKTHNPFAAKSGYEGKRPFCYALFHSFTIGFTLATAFFRSSDDEIGFRWYVFDRTKDLVDLSNVMNT